MGAKIGQWLLRLGVLLIAVALILAGVLLYTGIHAGREADDLLAQIEDKIPSADDRLTPDYLLHPDMEMPEVEIEGNLCIGMLELPSIQIELPILSQWEYDMLKVAPCRYKGSAYLNNLIIAAHNYGAHFGKLTEMELDDEVRFTDAVGNAFRYKVVQFEILEPTEVEAMESGNWDLTLFTCNSWITHRIAVRCERIS